MNCTEILTRFMSGVRDRNWNSMQRSTMLRKWEKVKKKRPAWGYKMEEEFLMKSRKEKDFSVYSRYPDPRMKYK